MDFQKKSKKKNFPKSVNEMSEEMLRETLKKKKECNAKALQTVEKLCEAEVEEEWFLANLQFINQTHYDDVTIERAIVKLCGYPLCSNKLEKIPTKQYHISTRYNKVFDITERKNFCSSSCYKSAMHVKKQLFTSPLWFRDKEVIPKYTVMKLCKSSMGEEVIFFPDKIQLEAEDIKKKEKNLDSGVKELKEKYSDFVIKDTQVSLNIKSEKKDLNKKITSSTESERVVETKEALNMQKGVQSIQPKVHTKEIDSDPIKKIEKCIFEWFSLHTLLYLYGEEKFRELFCDKVDKLKEILNSKLLMAGHNEKIDRMIQLYGLLDTDSLSKSENKANLKPLPDYSALKEEGKTIEIKVRAFYQGQLEVKETKKLEKKGEEVTTDESVGYLPLIDAHAQTALRRKIVLDKLNRILPDLVRSFHSDYVLQMSEVRDLVSTFSLAAHNITFKPSEWYLIGIILLKLMSLKNKHLETVIKTEFSESQTLLILTKFQLGRNYLDNLIPRLTDSSNIFQKLNEIDK